MELNKIIHGDVLKVLKEFPDNSVDCIITSPPYYSLRKYPEEANVEWPDGIKCQLGLEPTPEMYIEHLGLILKEIYRVLKPTGTFWLNIGDTYLKKQMLCIPERVLFKALEIGFILRNKIVWMKPNCLPSSVKDRLTNTYEFVYLLTKKPKYYFNLDAIRVPLSEKTLERVKKFLSRGESFDPNKHKVGNGQNPYQVLQRLALSFNYRVREAKKGHFGIIGVRASEEEMEKYDEKGVKLNSGKWTSSDSEVVKFMREKGSGGQYDYGGINSPDSIFRQKYRSGQYLKKNPGDMWELTTEPFPEAHFAVFPVKLVVRCIVAGCPPNGIVLDPFMGSGTVALACELLNHKMWDKIPKFEEIVNPEVVKSIDWNLKWIGIEIVKDYIDMTYRRLNKEIYNNSKPLTEWLK